MHFALIGQLIFAHTHTHSLHVGIRYASPDPTAAIKEGEWITAEAAARIDLSGGWSDTPPVTYEHGGAVCNASILIDGKRPIGASARRIPECELVLVMGNQTITVSDYVALATYAQPQSPVSWKKWTKAHAQTRALGAAFLKRERARACVCVCVCVCVCGVRRCSNPCFDVRVRSHFLKEDECVFA